MESSRRAEAWDAASGALLFAGIVTALGGAVALIGWAAGNIETVGILAGCAVLSAMVAVAVRGLLRWGIEDVPVVEGATLERIRHDARMKRAA
jgi:hypothetical protein